MRIAVIGLRGFPDIQGGVESHCENIIPRLSAEHQCTVYRRKPYIPKGATARYDGVSFVDLPSTRIKGFEALFHTFLSAAHIILHHNVDVVNIHNIGPGLFTPMLRMFGYKVVLTYHSPNYEHAKWGFFSRQLLKTGEFMSLRFANRVIFVNKFQMGKYSPKVQSRSTYIPNGIKPLSYVLAVGRLTPEKGFDTLIKAINKTEADIRLVIAGSADHSPEYLDQLKSLDINGRVTFTGFTTGEDLRQLYSHARLFALSSNNEGFPIVLLEAMSYGLPLIVTDIPATHLIELPSEAYTPAGDAEAMAAAIERAYGNGSTARVTYEVLSQYHWDNIARQTAQVYNSLKP